MSDGGVPGRRDDDISMAVVAHRIGELERAVVRLGAQIEGLKFVPENVYHANQVTADLTHKALAKDIRDLDRNLCKDIDEVRKLSIWALSTIGVALLGAVVAGIGRLAGL